MKLFNYFKVKIIKFCLQSWLIFDQYRSLGMTRQIYNGNFFVFILARSVIE